MIQVWYDITAHNTAPQRGELLITLCTVEITCSLSVCLCERVPFLKIQGSEEACTGYHVGGRFKQIARSARRMVAAPQ